MKQEIKDKIITRILNLFKIKSIVTFVFLGLTIYSAVKMVNLPEWLVPIIAMGLKELFDKDKVTSTKENKEE